MKQPHAGCAYLEVCQLELDFFEVGYRLLLDSKDFHLLIDHTLSQRSVFHLSMWQHVRSDMGSESVTNVQTNHLPLFDLCV